jgi:hypothetical protein
MGHQRAPEHKAGGEVSPFEQRLADIEQHVKDGLITPAEGRRKIADLKKMKAFAAQANSIKILE